MGKKKTPEPEKVTPTQAAERMGPAIVAISTWWANQVMDPTFNNMGPAELSQGEVEGFKLAMKLTPGNLIDQLTSVVSGMRPNEHTRAVLANGLASMTADLNPVSASDAKRFRDVMIERLVHHYEERFDQFERNDEWGFAMDVDYGPDGFLASVAEMAGVSLSRFPWKTRTVTHENYVTVGLGYGAQQRVWWKREGYYIGKCASQKYVTSESNGGGKILYHPYECGLERYHHGEHAFTDILPLCKHCNRPDKDTTMHTGAYGTPADHAFEAGQADICVKCWEARRVAAYMRDRHEHCWKFDRAKGQYGEWVEDGEHDFRPHPDLLLPEQPDVVLT